MSATKRGASPGRAIAAIAVPVSLEFVIMLVLNFVNQVIVGGLGTTAIAAVGFANSIVFIGVVTLSAIGVSVSVLVARAFGGGHRHALSSTVTAAIVLALALSLPLTIVLVVWAEPILTGTGASAEVAAAGLEYLRLNALSLAPAVIVAALSGVMRSMGHPRGPLWATLATAALQTVLAWGLVFGRGPLPDLGVAGAGWAVLVSTVIKLAILVVLVFFTYRLSQWEFPRGAAEWSSVVRPLIVLAIPLGLTELLWTTGIFLYNVVAARLGVDALAAAQIVATLEGVFIVGSVGLMTAATALIGREIGRGDAPAAIAWIARIDRASVATSLVFGALFAVSALSLGVLFPETSDLVRQMAVIGILIQAAAQVVKVRNMILGAGVLPSGNDVKGVIMGDAIAAFAVGLPVAIVLGLWTPLGIIGIFIARVVEELAKLAIFEARRRRIDWSALAAEHAPASA